MTLAANYRLCFLLICLTTSCGIKYVSRFGTKTAYEASINGFYELLPPSSRKNSSQSNAKATTHSWPEFCLPVQLNGLIRHGIRNPNYKDINYFMSAVRKIGTRSENVNKPLYESLLKLRDVVTSYGDKSLLPSGVKEQKYLAKRIYERYTDLLKNINVDDIHLVVSSAQRTVDSCVAFMEQMLLGNKNIMANLKMHTNDSLIRYFDLCEKYVKEVDEDEKNSLHEYHKYQQEHYYKIIEKLSKRLHLTGDKSLSKKELKALYIMSATEVATLKSSNILALFDEEDLAVLEYAIDLKNYWKKSYGHEINYKQSCPLLKDIMQHLNDAVQNKSYHKAVLRFGHAETLLPMLTLIGLYKDEPKLRAANYEIHANRKFRTSNISPFSANVFFVLFKCKEGSQNGIMWSKYMVQVLVNETPVIIPSCKQELCSFEQIKNNYKNVLDSCDFQTICNLRHQEEL